MQVGDRVTANGFQNGTIRYIGRVSSVALDKVNYVGIELDEPEGSGDGTISGHTYFTCPEYHALFVNVQMVEPMHSNNNS